MWTASNGGVLVWDLSSISSFDYVQSSRHATTALAFCDWEMPFIFAGSDRGVTKISAYYFDEYDPYFPLLEHPGDEDFGRVLALACDDQRQQLWVGYTGFLGRYDDISQSW